MTFLALSFIAGMLTVLSPCILPLLPLVIGSSASGRSRATPYTVVASLAVSIILFTYVLKASTLFVSVPPMFWAYLSGGILALFGLTLAFPGVWEKVPGVASLSLSSNKLVAEGHSRKSFWGDVLIGAALGPVFSTCSPTYFVILASVLPVSFALGSLYLLAYTFGLSLVLMLIAILGERFARRLDPYADPRGWFKRSIGVLFLLLGLTIIFGLEKKIEAKILGAGYLDTAKVEQRLLEKSENPLTLSSTTTKSISAGDLVPNPEANPIVTSAQNSKLSVQNDSNYPFVPYVEIVNPSGFVNTNDAPVRIGDYVGKKVILVYILTYSCINCQRTFPYVNSWYEKYENEGFIVIGIHTPEFAYEREKANVEEAMKQYGITFPVILDNEYATWNAYGNKYWPRRYLIDIHGNIVYDHIGEGGYAETETKIKELLDERTRMQSGKK